MQCKSVVRNEKFLPVETIHPSSQKILKTCLTESGKMIKLCMNDHDVLTRPDQILVDSVRRAIHVS